MRALRKENSRGIGERRGDSWEMSATRRELVDLPIITGVFRLLRRNEMAHDELKGEAPRELGRGGGFLRRDAQAAHARVNLERRRRRRRERDPFGNLVERV